MKYSHPSITVAENAPGHFSITGHKPGAYFVEGVGHVVPLDVCDITPQIPSDLLLAIVGERGDLPKSKGKPLAAHISEEEANELKDVLHTLTASGTALITSARELVNSHEMLILERANLQDEIEMLKAERDFGDTDKPAEAPTAPAPSVSTPAEVRRGPGRPAKVHTPTGGTEEAAK